MLFEDGLGEPEAQLELHSTPVTQSVLGGATGVDIRYATVNIVAGGQHYNSDKEDTGVEIIFIPYFALYLKRLSMAGYYKLVVASQFQVDPE